MHDPRVLHNLITGLALMVVAVGFFGTLIVLLIKSMKEEKRAQITVQKEVPVSTSSSTLTQVLFLIAGAVIVPVIASIFKRRR